ncbi:DUF4342 domain-containing protein [Roseovarius rhodophyticola]|uniref:DUF4342 domain-containing protein n=1 Tax=Roseovarius rhodophyticola TaxID=3080827 RepID=A0ABZ2TEH0_9RHOB|nr:DUF4342 domain-containing protein [Roseovarius sp. W115]MDV2928294.1 DUF4342 domain-containing protein [Roseovarius sp. W115]
MALARCFICKDFALHFDLKTVISLCLKFCMEIRHSDFGLININGPPLARFNLFVGRRPNIRGAPDMDDENRPKKTFIEEIEVAGDKLVERVKELAKEGSVRQLKILADDGDVFLETPLNIGLAVGGVVVLAAPWLAILGVIAGLVTKVRIVVEREVEDETSDMIQGSKTDHKDID